MHNCGAQSKMWVSRDMMEPSVSQFCLLVVFRAAWGSCDRGAHLRHTSYHLFIETGSHV